ncbi:MAG: 6-bladed beta-propeller [Candidatus Aegiribacteria sp.]
MKALFSSLFSFLVIVMLSCGAQREDEARPRPRLQPDTLTITVEDTIGLMTGDSNYVFGNITEAELGPEGNIYVLDGLLCRLSIFSPEGEHIESVGRAGSGPGEYQYPRSMALYEDGSLVISDWPAATITYLGPDLGFDTVLTTFGQLSPHSVEPLPGGEYVGGGLEYRTGGEMPEGDLFLARYGRDVDPKAVLWRSPLMIDVVMENGEAGVYISNADAVWDTSLEGDIYLSVRSDSTWWFMGMSPDGDTLLYLNREWERVPKSPEELARGEYLESLSFSDGASTSISRRRDTENLIPWRQAISSLDVDDQGRIWLGQGWSDRPVFEVYDEEGSLLFVAAVPGLAGTEGIEYSIRGSRMIGYDTEPMDYPKVYLMDIGISEE